MNKKTKILDVFFFNGEIEMLKFRLSELNNSISQFIVVERGESTYLKNKSLFEDFNEKISHILLDSGLTLEEEFKKIRNYLISLDILFDDIIFISEINELPDLSDIEKIHNELIYDSLLIGHIDFTWNKDYINKNISLGTSVFFFTTIFTDKNSIQSVWDYKNGISNFSRPVIKSGWKFSEFHNTDPKYNYLREECLPLEEIIPSKTYLLLRTPKDTKLPNNIDILTYNPIGRDTIKKHLFLVEYNTDAMFEYWEKEYDTISIIDFSNNLNETIAVPLSEKATRSILYLPNKVLYGNKSLKEFQKEYKKNEIQKIISTVFPKEQDIIEIINPSS
jgi:hypothetical protein